MWLSLPPGSLTLKHAQIQSLRHAKGIIIHCQTGVLWLSEEGDARDIVLHAGQRYCLQTEGLIVLEAIGTEASLRIERAASWQHSLASKVLETLARFRLPPLPSLAPLKPPRPHEGGGSL